MGGGEGSKQFNGSGERRRKYGERTDRLHNWRMLFTAWLRKWMDILVTWFFKVGQMLQGKEIEGLIPRAIIWILETELRFLINKKFLGEGCVRTWKISNVLVRIPWRHMKVAKTLIESIPCKGDFHTEEIWQWSCVAPFTTSSQQDVP